MYLPEHDNSTNFARIFTPPLPPLEEIGEEETTAILT
jgi:hypothetical protein